MNPIYEIDQRLLCMRAAFRGVQVLLSEEVTVFVRNEEVSAVVELLGREVDAIHDELEVGLEQLRPLLLAGKQAGGEVAP